MTDRAFISEGEIDRALDYLRDNATAAAQARANRAYVEEYRKVLKARLMKEHNATGGGLALAAQEREAYADQRYVTHLDALKDAVESDETHRFMMAAAQAKIEAWRSQEANIRAAGKLAA